MSNTQVDHSRLAELAAKLGLHAHLCLIYETQEEQLAAALPYLRAGLERGEKCFYIADENTASAVLDALHKGGTDVNRYLRSGALTLASKNDVFRKTGRFDADLLIPFWIEAAAQAEAEGFPGLRVLPEMTWTLGDGGVPARLIEFESKVNHMCRDHKITGICQYKRAGFPPEVLLGVLRTHPIVVYGGLVAKNPYYVPPEELLKPDQAALEVDRLLKNIVEWQQAQEALRHSEERFRALFEGVQVGVVVSGPKSEVRLCNPAALELLGVTEDQLLGTTSFDPGWKAVYEDGSPCPGEKHPIPQVIATGQPVRNAVLGVYRVGLQDAVWLLVSAQPQFAADGGVSQVICCFEDITERKRAGDDLRRQKEILQKIFDNVPVMIDFTGADGRIELVNREWERTIGWTLKEIREQNVDIFGETYPDPQYRQEVLEFVAAAEGRFADFKTRIRDGRVIDTSWARVRLSDGTTIGIGRDITERKRAEERLRQSEADFAAAQRVARLGTWRFDIGANTVRWSEELYRIFDIEKTAFGGTYESFLSRVHPDDRPRVVEMNRKARASGEPFDLDYRIVTQAGEVKDIREIGYAVKDAGDRVVGLFGTAQDITDRKRAERELRRSEAYLAESQRISHVGSWAWNVATREIIFWSQENYDIYGFDPNREALTFQKVLQRIHPDDRPVFDQAVERMVREERDFELDFRLVLPDGSIKYIHSTGHPIVDERGRLVEHLCTHIDFTERRRTEERLREYEKVVEGLEEMIVVLDRDYRFLIANRAYLRYRGNEKEQVLGRLLSDISDKGIFETTVKKRLDECLRGKVVRYELKYPFANIGERDLFISYFPIEGRFGVDRVAVILRDITERKRAEEELERSRDQLRALAARLQNVREEERTRVAREIHDELGQALTAIRLDLSSLVHNLPPENKQQSGSLLRLVDETIQSVRRISTELRPAVLDALGLVPALEWAAEEFETRTGTKCRVDLPEDDLVVDLERSTALFRIFQEALTNVARHANAAEVNVRLVKEDGSLTLEVHDNGQGISQDQLAAGRSLGILGMRERALLLGGELTVSGAPGKGTTVRVRIPETSRTPPEGGR
jgi:PAS domain S-box-containing protein